MTQSVYNTPYLLGLDEKPLQSLTGHIHELELEKKITQEHVLTFEMPVGEVEIMTEQQIIYKGERFVITDVEYSRGHMMVYVTAESAIRELTGAYIEWLQLPDRPVPEIAEKLLERTRWKFGGVEIATANVSFMDDNQNVLQSLKKLAEISDYFLKFDTVKRLVYFNTDTGESRELLLRYRRNLEEVKKKVKLPEYTKIKPVGKDDVTIFAATGGKTEYIEDLSFYESLGFTKDEARRRFEKAKTWYDRRFLNSKHLLKAGKKKLKELSQPQIVYEAEARLLEEDARNVDVGDYGFVVDEELGIKVNVRVVRKIETLDVDETMIELNYLLPGLENRSSEGSGGGGNETAISQVRLEKDVTVGGNVSVVLSMPLTAFKATHAQIGLHVVGEASGNGVIDGHFQFGSTKLPTIIKQSVTAGWHTIAASFVFNDVPEGTDVLNFYLKSSTTFKIKEEQAEMFVTADGMLGGLGGGPPSVSVKDVVERAKIDLSKFKDKASVIFDEQILKSFKEQVPAVSPRSVKDIKGLITYHTDLESFADISKYPDLTGLSQDDVNSFVLGTHLDKKGFMLFDVGGRLAVVASSSQVNFTEWDNTVSSTKDMFLLDSENSNTMIGRKYSPRAQAKLLDAVYIF